MERVTRIIMAKDHRSEESPGTDEFHISLWFDDVKEDGEVVSKHRRKDMPAESTLADILAEIPNYESWAE